MLYICYVILESWQSSYKPFQKYNSLALSTLAMLWHHHHHLFSDFFFVTPGTNNPHLAPSCYFLPIWNLKHQSYVTVHVSNLSTRAQPGQLSLGRFYLNTQNKENNWGGAQGEDHGVQSQSVNQVKIKIKHSCDDWGAFPISQGLCINNCTIKDHA